MKVKELFEAAGDTLAKITQGLKALKVKGMKFDVKFTKNATDVYGTAYPKAWKVGVSYAPGRGVRQVEKVTIYQTKDGDWGYSTQMENKEAGTLDDVLFDLGQYLKASASFHSKGAAVREEQLNELKLPSKLKRWAHETFWGSSPEDVIKRQRNMSDDEVLTMWRWYQEELTNPKYKAPKRGTPRDIQIRALEKEVKRRKLELPKIDASHIKTEGVVIESHGDDLQREAKKLKRAGDERGYNQQMVKYYKHMIDAYEWNVKQHGKLSLHGQQFTRDIKDFQRKLAKHEAAIVKKEDVITEGYESKVLKILKKAGITDAYFEKGTLFLQTKDDWKQATQALRDADEINELPSMEYLG